ncbi:MAG TPA: dihydroorotase [Polyangia bacterium]|nr:dihydroorotase [Polyangia bacterium]
MHLVLRGGRVIDPQSKRDKSADVLISEDRIARIEPGLAAAAPKGARIIDCRDRYVVPGLVDLHVHLREPGHEYKEDIASGTRAAAAGGFSTVCCMPNTTPPNDCRAVTDLILNRAREVGQARVRPVGAISKGLAGETLAEMGEMKDAGVVAVSDDGRPVANGELMRRALEYAKTFGLPVVQHAEDLELSAGGVMNEGVASTRAGLRGQPAAAEAAMVARDLELVAWTGTRYHVAHVSSADTVRLLRDAKRRGLPVTCEVTPHHLTLTDLACLSYDTATKCAPPLRTQADVDALRAALADGTIDCIATDHAPHTSLEKDLEFDLAAFGMIGLETALPLTLRLVAEKALPLERAIEALTSAPARALALGPGVGALEPGGPADVTVIDPDRRVVIDRARGRSKSQNTPFHGWELRGCAILTVCAGRVTYEAEGG